MAVNGQVLRELLAVLGEVLDKILQAVVQEPQTKVMQEVMELHLAAVVFLALVVAGQAQQRLM